eukprot:CAMPEP_0115842462 /NCGR_PEP_ID=MMETSP0287-20121206/7813_1 /TAXON_ID=412157 /ORGANISM="Chrysochromulina rotalis, Strain UIO044" /LENGTH=137 /DNA_ID=CAMNT_0003296133 /DNA_START=24 /DNA_END=437 /DNA_ORIENTATION=+
MVAWLGGYLSPTVITPRAFLILFVVTFVAFAAPAFKHLGHAIARVDDDASVFAVLGKATHLAAQALPRVLATIVREVKDAQMFRTAEELNNGLRVDAGVEGVVMRREVELAQLGEPQLPQMITIGLDHLVAVLIGIT